MPHWHDDLSGPSPRLRWPPVSVTPVPREQPTIRVILRVVVTVVLSALALVLMYLVREPLGWVVLAMFLAIAASGPVNFLSRHIPRTGAVATVYLAIVLIPIGIALILIPPVVEQGVRLVDNLGMIGALVAIPAAGDPDRYPRVPRLSARGGVAGSSV